jgi:hypothetical protein
MEQPAGFFHDILEVIVAALGILVGLVYRGMAARVAAVEKKMDTKAETVSVEQLRTDIKDLYEGQRETRDIIHRNHIETLSAVNAVSNTLAQLSGTIERRGPSRRD